MAAATTPKTDIERVYSGINPDTIDTFPAVAYIMNPDPRAGIIQTGVAQPWRTYRRICRKAM